MDKVALKEYVQGSFTAPVLTFAPFAVALNLGVVAYVSLQNVRWLSIVSILVLFFWIMVVRFAGRKFEELSTLQTVKNA